AMATPMPATTRSAEMTTTGATAKVPPMLRIGMTERKMNPRQQQSQKTYFYRMCLLHSYAPTLVC
ncbi:MAG: hypothetical protein ABF468_05320, partial [Acetobacter fabarum]|uniref:hypothetical protein n=1 Tax=Acetobacter fabarum TaxID=483199 RepID=UPI0039E9FFC5